MIINCNFISSNYRTINHIKRFSTAFKKERKNNKNDKLRTIFKFKLIQLCNKNNKK